MPRPYIKSGKYVKRDDAGAPAPGLLTTRQLADRLNVTTKTIQHYVNTGMPSAGRHGAAFAWDLNKCLEWIKSAHESRHSLRGNVLAHMNLAAAGEEQLDLGGVDRQTPMGDTARVKLFLETEKIALYLGAQKRELIPREEVEADYRATFGVLRQQLLGLGASIARTLSLDYEKQREIEKLVRGFMESLQSTIADEMLRPPREDFEIPAGLLTGVMGLLKTDGQHVA